MTNQGTESQFEATTIERLRALGYPYRPASTLDRDLKSVVLADRMRAHLARRYPHLPEKALDEAVTAARNPDGVTLDQRNMSFHQMLTRGYELKYEVAGEDRYEHIYFVDWDEPKNNDFPAVNQLTVEGQNTRRPDLVIYVNGLPLVVFELKSTWDEYANVDGAYNQLQHYRADIPRLFEFNTFCVLSDGVDMLQGMYSGPCHGSNCHITTNSASGDTPSRPSGPIIDQVSFTSTIHATIKKRSNERSLRTRHDHNAGSAYLS